MHSPVILSGAKDPLPARATTGSGRSFHYRHNLRADHWPLITDH
jgi:hypothetical protein